MHGCMPFCSGCDVCPIYLQPMFTLQILHRRRLHDAGCTTAVVPLLRVHVPSSAHAEFVRRYGTPCVDSATTEGDNTYVLVMPLADRSLWQIITSEQVAGCNLVEIKGYMQQIARCQREAYRHKKKNDCEATHLVSACNTIF